MKVVTDKDEMRNLSANVLLALREKDWTQQDLAAASGVSQPVISNVLRGKHEPTIGVVSRLAKALRKPIDGLLSAPPRKKLRNAS
jgi:transcriptional regulator with XRE-family HTH domain